MRSDQHKGNNTTALRILFHEQCESIHLIPSTTKIMTSINSAEIHVPSFCYFGGHSVLSFSREKFACCVLLQNDLIL